MFVSREVFCLTLISRNGVRRPKGPKAISRNGLHRKECSQLSAMPSVYIPDGTHKRERVCFREIREICVRQKKAISVKEL